MCDDLKNMCEEYQKYFTSGCDIIFRRSVFDLHFPLHLNLHYIVWCNNCDLNRCLYSLLLIHRVDGESTFKITVDVIVLMS